MFTVLVVEDNPITRKMLRVALETDGYSVVEAPDGGTALERVRDGAPDLVLTDLVLPDINGVELGRRIGALPGMAGAPVLALSGLISHLEEARVAAAGFSAFLPKPIEPADLLAVVRAHLPARPATTAPGNDRRILVAEDEPVMLKLLRLQLTQAGFRVESASDGLEALARARSDPPDAIVSDVLMPGLDGLDLCLEVRRDPRLAHVPVVLVSSYFVDAEDHELAAHVGASRLVNRVTGAEELITPVLESLAAPPPAAAEELELPRGEYSRRLLRHLKRQAAANAGLARRLALQEAQLALLRGVTAALARNTSVERAVHEVLAACLEGSGLSRAALYVRDGAGLRLEETIGYTPGEHAAARAFFGHHALLEALAGQGQATAIPSAGIDPGAGADLLREAGVGTALVAPLVQGGRRLGALFLGSGAGPSDGGAPFQVAYGLTPAIAQSLALAATLRLLTQSSLLLAETPACEEALPRVARLALPLLGAWCTIDLVGDDGRLQRVAGAHVDPGREALLARLAAAHPPTRDGPAPWATALRRGVPELLPSVGESDLSALVPDPQARALLRELGFRTCMAIPVTAHERPLGVLTFADGAPDRRYGEDDLSLANELARRCALALENARLHRESEAAVRMRDDFLATAAHELRTPLSVLRLQSQALLHAVRTKGGAPPAAKLESRLGRIEGAVDRLALLVERLLDVSRLTTGHLELELEEVDLGGVARAVAGKLRDYVAEAGCALEVRTGAGAITGWWDRARLEQVTANLLTNAAKYGGGQPIQLAVDGDDDRARLVVRDQGIGIPAEDQGRLFGRFERLAPRQHYAGVGLGLWIVRAIVAALGGSVEVRSRPGEGSTFTVTLPRRPPEARSNADAVPGSEDT